MIPNNEIGQDCGANCDTPLNPFHADRWDCMKDIKDVNIYNANDNDLCYVRRLCEKGRDSWKRLGWIVQ